MQCFSPHAVTTYVLNWYVCNGYVRRFSSRNSDILWWAGATTDHVVLGTGNTKTAAVAMDVDTHVTVVEEQDGLYRQFLLAVYLSESDSIPKGHRKIETLGTWGAQLVSLKT